MAVLEVDTMVMLYTRYESIAGELVRVVGTLAYSEAAKVPFNMTVLAINERVIAVKDENLEERIKGGVDLPLPGRKTETRRNLRGIYSVGRYY